MRLTVSLLASFVLAIPAASLAQHEHAPDQAFVDFGILPLTPIGGAPCLQAGAIGGPADPCSFKLHVLIPEETTVAKGGEVTFQIHGGGHGFAIYRVNKKTTRDDIGQQLCVGDDPATVTLPALNACNATTPAGAANANARHVVNDAKDDVVLIADTGTTTHPNNRVWYEPGRFVSSGAQQFLNGGTIPAGATSNGQLITYQFLKTGRYLVLCMNRSHFLNDWMFGFVNVEE